MTFENEAHLALWAAVLRQARMDLQNEEHRPAVVRWINAESEELGSFTWICSLLKESPDYIRKLMTA